jgi:hypothetical protein
MMDRQGKSRRQSQDLCCFSLPLKIWDELAQRESRQACVLQKASSALFDRKKTESEAHTKWISQLWDCMLMIQIPESLRRIYKC